MNIFKHIFDILWLTDIGEDCKNDANYGEVGLFLLVYPARLILLTLIATPIFLGIKHPIAISSCLGIAIWILIGLAIVLEDILYDSSPKYNAHIQKGRNKRRAKAKEKHKQEQLNKIEQHKNDPPKPVTKGF